MNRAEIRRRAFRYLDEDPDAPVYVSVDEVNDLIDEALEIVSEEIKHVKRTGYLPLRQGVQFYNTLAIDPYCLSPTRLWVGEKALKLTSVMELSGYDPGWLTHKGERPHLWYPIDHTTFGIYPGLSQSSGDVMRVEYYAWVRRVADDYAYLPFEDATLDAVVNYVVYSGLLKRWDIARAADVYRDFVDLFADSGYRREVRRYYFALLNRESSHG